MKENTIRAIVEARNSGKSVSAMSFVTTNPKIPALISKLIRPAYQTAHDEKGMRQITMVDQSSLKQVSDAISQRAKDADTIMELFPEMELAAQILISSIISPKDMISTEINYSVPSHLRVAPLAGILIPIIKEHLDTNYPIEPKLSDILHECLFGSGSCPIAVIPENSVDELINGQRAVSAESLSEIASKDGTFKPIGVLGSPNLNTQKNFSLEDFNHRHKQTLSESERFIHYKYNNRLYTLEYLTVTDNFNALKLPRIIDNHRKQAMESIITPLSHSHGSGFQTSQLNDAQLTSLFYKNRYNYHKNIIKVKSDAELNRSTIGEPLILKLPAESTIPVYTPGDEKKHIGYFVLLDSEGNPLSRSASIIDEEAAAMSLGMNTDMGSYLLRRSANQLDAKCSPATFRQASRVYADIIEADLLARLRNGIVGPAVSVAKNEEVYRIMLARALQKQATQLLYVPIELMTYFAVRYDDYGVGTSLLDKMRNLMSLRAMLLFSKTMAQVRNSIGRSKVAIKIDPESPDPQKAIETAIHEWARTRQQNMPIGTINVGDLTEWIQKAGVEFSFEGHPGLPDMSIDFSEHSTNYSEPNQDLSENLERKSIMGALLPPEAVDNSTQPEFAISVATSNALLAKRVIKIQETFTPQLSDHCQKVCLYNSHVVEQVKIAIKDNLKKITDIKEQDPVVLEYKDAHPDLLIHLLAMEFLSNFEVSLAAPDTIALKNQQESMDVYEQILDKAINYYISSDILTSAFTGEEASQRVDEVKAIIKAYFMRQWMAENHVAAELAQLGAIDDEGQPVLDFGVIYKDHSNAMTKSIVSLIGSTHPVAAAADKDITKITGGEDLGASEVSDTSSSDSTDSSSGDIAGFGDENDMFNLGGDLGETSGGQSGQEPEGDSNQEL